MFKHSAQKLTVPVVHAAVVRNSSVGSLPELKSVLASKVTQEREKLKEFKKKNGKSKLGEVTVDSVFGGLRNVTCLWCETSHLDPLEGIRFRGYSIPEITKLLPKAEGGKQPLPEGLFWLLLTGDIPSKAQVDSVSKCWAINSELPPHVEEMLNRVPGTTHPMTQLSAAVTLLNTDSVFAPKVHEIKKTAYWEFYYEDALKIIPKLTTIAAKIYRHSFFNDDSPVKMKPDRDWAENFTDALGFESKMNEAMRLYLTLHADHEGGNVSSSVTHIISSALADPALSLAGGLNGLAGPLHGLAAQDCLAYLLKVREALGEDPTEEAIEKFVANHIQSGRVVPGFGHAVLRKTDPRYTSFKEFAEKNMPDDPLKKLLHKLVGVVVPYLQKLGKVSNPYPNVDCHSGTILQHYGLKETTYYTVLFGVSRAMGVLSSTLWHRAVGLPIQRPLSATTAHLAKLINAK